LLDMQSAGDRRRRDSSPDTHSHYADDPGPPGLPRLALLSRTATTTHDFAQPVKPSSLLPSPIMGSSLNPYRSFAPTFKACIAIVERQLPCSDALIVLVSTPLCFLATSSRCRTAAEIARCAGIVVYDRPLTACLISICRAFNS
jgi:hypothetical protein